MGAVAALREDMIGAYKAADVFLKTHMDDAGDLNAEDDRQFKKLFTAAQRLEGRFKAAQGDGVETKGGSAEDRLAEYTTRPEGMAEGLAAMGLPFPGSGGYGGAGIPSGRKSIHGQSWGDAVVKAATTNGDGFKALVGSGSTAVGLPINLPPVPETQRVDFIRQLIPTENTLDGAFGYIKQTLRTNNAAVVPEGTRKPTSEYTVVRIDDRVDTIAHLSEPIPRQYLDDARMLRKFVDDELRHGLDLALDAEIVAAILAEASPAGSGLGTDPLTDLRKGITALQIAGHAPDGFAMHPSDWETVELAASEQFAANSNMNPTDALTRRLYGVAVVVSTSVAAGTALLGDFRGSSLLVMRQQARVDWSEGVFDPTFEAGAGATDFERNLIRFRAEMRAKLAVTRATGFRTIDLEA